MAKHYRSVNGPQLAGALRSRASKPSGTINNTKPWTIGGKSSCSSSTVTCDYVAGDIDYVKLTKGWTVELPGRRARLEPTKPLEAPDVEVEVEVDGE